MKDIESVYSNSYNYISEFISYYHIPSVENVEDVLKYYSDFYVSKKKDEDGNVIDHYFKFFGILKKKTEENRAKTISIFYFGKKKESELLNEYSDVNLKNFDKRFEMFSIHFHILKRFSEINELEKKLDEIH